MSKPVLTAAEMEALVMLASGRLMSPVLIATEMHMAKQARGSFCARFRRLYKKGCASLTIDANTYFYRITNIGRAKLSLPGGDE